MPNSGTGPHAQRQTPITQVRGAYQRMKTKSPSRFAVLIFTGIIFIWAGLLMLPISSASGEVTPFVDALFTAVSTICVTGLSVVDMSSHWSPFGDAVVFAGIQVGAVGVLTLASILGAVVTRKLGLRQKLVAASDGNSLRLHAGAVSESQAVRLGEIGGVLVTVVSSLAIIESIVAAGIFPALVSNENYKSWWQALFDSYYFAASAFTNTGFVPTTHGLEPFVNDAWVLGCLATAVFAGSLGFPVIFSLVRWARTRQRLGLHVKLTLVTTVALFFAGWVAIYFLEGNNEATFGTLNDGMQPFTAGFMSVMTRSGGFATVDIGQMNESTVSVMSMLMFVGGGSASTAGGIKVTTFAILFLAAVAEARGVKDIQAFRRRIPVDVLRLAISVALWGATIVAFASIAIMQVSQASMKEAVFDTISAFATVGLSTGLTERLPDEGVYILSATMWLGRVGTVTFAAALASRQKKQLYTLPEERIIVG
ncbi:TrkH family potassium uptake protein [Gulosibacter bifidus]|uniref:TrkH family potassium uptake protein n=1 Tax=Gulosibacter bifidus TaxID=272239 RepID=A0ABW5RJ32_9MICO|nr:potassium transporter TrkG [Gulosibacter bifidus]